MAGDVVRLKLAGKDVTLQDFAAGVADLRVLIEELQQHEAPDAAIEWQLHVLEKASATVAFRGIAQNAASKPAVLKVSRSFHDVGKDLRDGVVDRWPPKIERAARHLHSLINGHVKAVELGTDEDTVEITEVQPPPASAPIQMPRWGTVTGRVETINKHGELSFTLYDRVHDRAVRCYLAPGQEPLARDIWDKWAVVEGLISRDPATGQPLRVRQVKEVKTFDEQQRGAWKQAMGAAPPSPNSPLSPEDAIRRGRE